MAEVRGAATFHTSAEAYDRHVGRYGGGLAHQLIALAGLEPGQRALDVGCGPGALTAALAELLGADSVAAVDPSAPFAEACAARVGVRALVAPAEQLPFPDRSFDAALAQLVVNFMSDPPDGVREMGRVTRPGGAVAAAVWDYAGGMTLLRRFWDAAVAVDPDAVDRDEGRCMPYCRPDDLSDLWHGVGLEDVTVAPLVVEAEYAGFDDLWEPLETGVGPSGAYAASLAPEHRRRLRDELRRRLGVGEAPFRLSARAWGVAGRVPAPADL